MGGRGSKRQLPPKPVGKRWGPSDVEQRVSVLQAIQKTSAMSERKAVPEASRREKAQQLDLWDEATLGYLVTHMHGSCPPICRPLIGGSATSQQ